MSGVALVPASIIHFLRSWPATVERWEVNHEKKSCFFHWDLLWNSLVTRQRLSDWKSDPCNLLDPYLVVDDDEGSQPYFPPIDQGDGLAWDACGFVRFKPLQPIGQPSDRPILYP
jgi:hypothetical protein